MTTSRRKLIEPQITPFYHVINRCVRRAYLCGDDPYNGKNYHHRRGWIVNKIKQLAAVFCIDVCAYAVMSNHYHLVLKIDTEQQQKLTPKAVISRTAGINFAFTDYFELIDWTGRCVRNDKKGFIASSQPKILQQLGITADAWLEHSEQFMERYANVSGKWSRMCAFKQHAGGHWCKGKSASHQLHPN
ncbi:transposase [Photobacterium aquimaris]|nr:transposase [Photobacterium aquimaris]